jgi:hypothetical protein
MLVKEAMVLMALEVVEAVLLIKLQEEEVAVEAMV